MDINIYSPDGKFIQIMDTDYPFGCECGESYKSEDAAWNCRKCRIYLYPEDFANRKVYHGFPGIGDGVKIIDRQDSA